MDNILSIQNFESALERKKWKLKDLADEYDNLYADSKGRSIHSTLKDWRQGIGNPTLKRLSRVCDLLDCDIDYLLGNQDTPRKEYGHIAEMTGLSYDAAEYLSEAGNYLAPLLSRMLENPKLLQDIYSAAAADYKDGYLEQGKKRVFVSAEQMYNAERAAVFEEILRFIDDLRKDLPEEMRG